MESIEIGLWVSGFLLLLVLLGMRVAFAAAMAGLVGLVFVGVGGCLLRFVGGGCVWLGFVGVGWGLLGFVAATDGC